MHPMHMSPSGAPRAAQPDFPIPTLRHGFPHPCRHPLWEASHCLSVGPSRGCRPAGSQMATLAHCPAPHCCPVGSHLAPIPAGSVLTCVSPSSAGCCRGGPRCLQSGSELGSGCSPSASRCPPALHPWQNWHHRRSRRVCLQQHLASCMGMQGRGDGRPGARPTASPVDRGCSPWHGSGGAPGLGDTAQALERGRGLSNTGTGVWHGCAELGGMGTLVTRCHWAPAAPEPWDPVSPGIPPCPCAVGPCPCLRVGSAQRHGAASAWERDMGDLFPVACPSMAQLRACSTSGQASTQGSPSCPRPSTLGLGLTALSQDRGVRPPLPCAPW